jgi:Flp pilus assembly protein TadG
MRRRLDGRSSERGSAAVEFALVMPLVFVVTLGLVQIGLLARDRALVDAAARAGARVP